MTQSVSSFPVVSITAATWIPEHWCRLRKSHLKPLVNGSELATDGRVRDGWVPA